jgi:hypothetical protein
MDSVDAFAEEAGRFELWARDGITKGDAGAREALIRLTRLYVAGLVLPSIMDAARGDVERVKDEEWGAVLRDCSRLPLDYYGEIFDPLMVPPEEAGVGSLADDLADIYRDVVTGLRAYRKGMRSEALWEWGFGLQVHWGEHATGAIRALHCWLAANAPDRLTG